MGKKIIITSIIILIASFSLDKLIIESIPKSPYLFEYITFLTNFSTFIVLLVLTTIFILDNKEYTTTNLIWKSATTTFLLSLLIQFITMRQRPESIILIPFTNIIQYSFPSAHTAVACSTIPIIKQKWLRNFWIVFAVIIAASRIITKLHFFSDIIGGALLGLTIGYLYKR